MGIQYDKLFELKMDKWKTEIVLEIKEKIYFSFSKDGPMSRKSTN